jgi:hypothetical protein
MLKTVLFTPGPHGWGLPTLFTGEPGTAKSSVVERTCGELGLLCETVIASLREPSDFLGMPWVEKGALSYLPPAYATRLNTAGGGVIHFDEFNTAPAMVQKALLRVVFERVIGETKLNRRVRILASQNPVEMSADGTDLPMPMANRFIHWRWDAPSHTDWIDYMIGGAGSAAIGGNADPEALEEMVMAKWPVAYANATGLTTGFISRRPELLRKTPKPEDPNASKAWASLRTWEVATRAIAGGAIHGLGTIEAQQLLSGCVGEGAASEFLVYCEAADLPDFEELLDGKTTWKPDKRLDRTLAVYQGCAALVIPTNAAKRDARADKLWELMIKSVETSADLVFPAAKLLCRAKLSKGSAATKVLYQLEPIFRTAGIMP